MTKQLIASICVLGLVGMGVGMVVTADETVTATVTPQIISVSVTDGNVDYGILTINESNNTFDGTTGTVAPAVGQQIITSGSNVSIDIALRSSDAFVDLNTTDWALADTAGPDAFIHSYDIDTPIGGPAVWAIFPFDGTFDNTYASSVVTLPLLDDTATLDLKIDMPTGITDTSVHSITITVLVTES